MNYVENVGSLGIYGWVVVVAVFMQTLENGGHTLRVLTDRIIISAGRTGIPEVDIFLENCRRIGIPVIMDGEITIEEYRKIADQVDEALLKFREQHAQKQNNPSDIAWIVQKHKSNLSIPEYFMLRTAMYSVVPIEENLMKDKLDVSDIKC